MNSDGLNTGAMPHTDFTYEEFEGNLGSLYLSLVALKSSSNSEDQADWLRANEILAGFAARHCVRPPEAGIANPRPTREPWGQPSEESCAGIRTSVCSLLRDTGVGHDGEDAVALEELDQLTFRVLDRHGVIQVVRENGRYVEIMRWDSKSSSTLSQVIESER